MKIFSTNNLSLFKKHFILLFCSVALPVALLGYISYQKSRDQMEIVTSSLLESNLKQNSEKLGNLFTNVIEDSESAIGSHELQFMLSEQAKQDVNENLFVNSIFPMVDNLRSNFIIKIYPIRIDDFPNYLGRISSQNVSSATPWFQGAVAFRGSGFWYFDEANMQSNVLPMMYVRLIRSIKNLEPLAVMSIQVPNQAIDKLLIVPDDYPHLLLSIINSDTDRIIYSRDIEQATHNLNNPDYYRHTANINKSEWRLVSTIPKIDFIGPIQHIKTFSWIIFLISMLFITLLLVIITRKFTSPIKAIVILMKKVQRGKLDSCTDYQNRGDEIGQLTRGYNNMIQGMLTLIEATKNAEAEKGKHELQMLIHQINPHFLYNTLDSIKWKASMANEQTIMEMVDSLANMLRYSINSETFRTVEREVEHIKSYLNVMLLKSNNAFQVYYQIQPNVLNLPFLKLILQPIVENAVRHGMNKLPFGQGKIFVQIYSQGNDIICTVEDNGPGTENKINFMKPINEDNGGVGLWNVNRRLEIQFGADYGIVPPPVLNTGFKISLRHPIL